MESQKSFRDGNDKVFPTVLNWPLKLGAAIT